MTKLRNPKLVDNIMEQVPHEFRYHWCEADACACNGCVNKCVDYKAMGVSPLTHAEWVRWVQQNKLIPIEYQGEIYSCTAEEWAKLAKRSDAMSWIRTTYSK